VRAQNKDQDSGYRVQDPGFGIQDSGRRTRTRTRTKGGRRRRRGTLQSFEPLFSLGQNVQLVLLSGVTCLQFFFDYMC
jgi:hypothetical protein